MPPYALERLQEPLPSAPARARRAPRAMIVDDDPISTLVLAAALNEQGIEVRVAESGEDCLRAIGRRTAAVDVVLSDISMPGGMDGFELLERLHALDAELAVVLMTGYDSYDMVRRAMSIGAYDYIVKPIPLMDDAVDAVRRAAGSTRLTRERRELLEEVREQNVRLQSLNEELEILARTDALTGVFNRRHVDQSLERLMMLRANDPFAVSLLLLDIDHFKRINDDHGHEVGDEVLRMVALTLMSTLRPSDLVGRYGGEEFLLVLAGVAPQEARLVAERVLGSIGDIVVEHEGARVDLGASIGLAGVDAEQRGVDVRDIVRGADAAMYRAKSAGRNRVVSGFPMACPTPATPLPAAGGAGGRR